MKWAAQESDSKYQETPVSCGRERGFYSMESHKSGSSKPKKKGAAVKQAPFLIFIASFFERLSIAIPFRGAGLNLKITTVLQLNRIRAFCLEVIGLQLVLDAVGLRVEILIGRPDYRSSGWQVMRIEGRLNMF